MTLSFEVGLELVQLAGRGQPTLRGRRGRGHGGLRSGDVRQALAGDRPAGEQLVVALNGLGLDLGLGHGVRRVGGVEPVGQGTWFARFGIEPDQAGVFEAGAGGQGLELVLVQ